MLAEAMLFALAPSRDGCADQSTATTDFEPEEHKRKIRSTRRGFRRAHGYKINILDAPGFFDFAAR